MNLIVDKNKALKKWGTVLESLNVKDDLKKEWMAEYAEMHLVSENVAYSTLGNTGGMGNVLSPTVSAIPGGTWADQTNGTTYGTTLGGAQGSGDIAQNLLPISMKIAAQAIGLDLVAVKPSSSPRIELLFVDFKYDNNPDSSDQDERPLVFKVTATEQTALKALLDAHIAQLSITETIGGLDNRNWVRIGSSGTVPTTTEPTDKQFMLEFLGYSRVDGYPIFRAYRQVNTAANNAGWNFISSRNTFPNDTLTVAGYLEASGITAYSGATTATTSLSSVGIQLVSVMEDQLPGFVANWNINHAMTRGTDEQTYPGVIGPDVFTKSITVGDIEIASALKRTHIEDIKASTGMDIVQKMESVLINELTQTISKQIVAKIKELAEENRSSHTTPKTAAGVSKFDFDVDTYTSVSGPAPGGETYHSIQRKLVTKLQNASAFIATDGRVGPAQYAITNGNLASVIYDISGGYSINPVQNTSKMNTNGQVYPMGSVNNIAIYVDPYMRWDDNRIFLGRKNSVDQPGIVFVPYLMAQSINLISEATWAPRMLIRSRYAITDVGFFPWKQFMAIHVTDNNGILS